MSSNFYRTYIMLFLSALFFIALGIAIISYRYKIYEFTGDWSWAVQYLGGNGTVLAIVLIGMFSIGYGAAYPFGVFDRVNTPIQPMIFGQK